MLILIEVAPFTGTGATLGVRTVEFVDETTAGTDTELEADDEVTGLTGA